MLKHFDVLDSNKMKWIKENITGQIRLVIPYKENGPKFWVGPINGGVVLIWNADLATHDDVSELYNLVPDSKFIISQSGTYIDANFEPVDILNHQMIKRMLGTL